nr:MAG TPA: hypothetical protein [Caudoviricetes sp.]DAZ55867.1 MAG TPA: hypothetical protein [Caudoviricetes sp.]
MYRHFIQFLRRAVSAELLMAPNDKSPASSARLFPFLTFLCFFQA